jgi:GAF domain-containing protein
MGLRGAVILPFVVGRQSLGGILAQSSTPLAMSEDEVRRLISLTGQAATVLQSQHLLEQTQAALEQVQAVHRRYIRESWQDYVDAHRRAAQPAYLYDLEAGAAQAKIKSLPDLDLPEIDQALARRELIVSDGPGQEGGQTMALPISLRGEPIGVLAIEGRPDGRPWSKEEIALVEAVSAQLAQALDSARLFDEAQMSAGRERVLREVTERVRGAGDMKSVLQVAVQEIRRALGASRATIRLGTESQSRGRYE